MALPELFHHQARFVGCLSLRRVPVASLSLGSDAAGELDAFLPRHAQRIGRDAARAEYVWLTAQAYDDPGVARCPALGEDKRCRVQDDQKPLACRAVPLEPTLPDSLQLSVLEERARDAAFMGADCIRPVAGSPADAKQHLPVVVEGQRVVDAEAQRALELRRRALRSDKAHWGNRVFALLQRDVFEHPERVAALPEQGYLCLSLAPVLSVVSSLSNALTRRVVQYLNAQIELIAVTVGPPVREPTQAQRELGGMLRANLALRSKLRAARPLPQSEPGASEVEAWLSGSTLEEQSRG
jgi:hypothetical protein